MLQARIPAGDHTIVLHYWPETLTYGIVLALGSAAFLDSPAGRRVFSKAVSIRIQRFRARRIGRTTRVMAEISESPFRTSGDTSPVVVVPCFNEEHRIDEQAFLDLIEPGQIRLLFVNDGSTDGTGMLLDRLRQKAEGIGVLELSQNVGKGEAVRRGLRRAIESGAAIVGYFDADLSTPGSELLRMVRILDERTELVAVFGSRVARLGSRIQRSAVRHYTGRIFAPSPRWHLAFPSTTRSAAPRCSRVNESLVAAVQIPFPSAWSFDVILCQRLFDGTCEKPGMPISSFLEMPLEESSDVGGSKESTLYGSLLALRDILVLGIARYVSRHKRLFAFNWGRDVGHIPGPDHDQGPRHR